MLRFKGGLLKTISLANAGRHPAQRQLTLIISQYGGYMSDNKKGEDPDARQPPRFFNKPRRTSSPMHSGKTPDD